MLALDQWPLEDRRRITGVFTDIDDTLTTEGAITPEALQALADLKAAGLPVIAITGRPVGWSEPFALAWPVDAIVPENGAVALLRSATQPGTLTKLYQQDTATRQANFARMQQVLARLQREVPGAMPSRDSPGRETDIAIDHSEFTQLPAQSIARVVAIMRGEGMHATVSSIHINGWYGGHDKLSGAHWIARQLLGLNLAEHGHQWVYVGDSTNDERMFAYFPNSIGVANVRRFEGQLTTKPRYITQGERGAGFAEVARAILAAQSGA